MLLVRQFVIVFIFCRPLFSMAISFFFAVKRAVQKTAPTSALNCPGTFEGSVVAVVADEKVACGSLGLSPTFPSQQPRLPRSPCLLLIGVSFESCVVASVFAKKCAAKGLYSARGNQSPGDVSRSNPLAGVMCRKSSSSTVLLAALFFGSSKR